MAPSLNTFKSRLNIHWQNHPNKFDPSCYIAHSTGFNARWGEHSSNAPREAEIAYCVVDYRQVIGKLSYVLTNEIFRSTGLQVNAILVSSPETRAGHKIRKFLLFSLTIYMIQSCFVYFIAIFTFLHCLQTNAPTDDVILLAGPNYHILVVNSVLVQGHM